MVKADNHLKLLSPYILDIYIFAVHRLRVTNSLTQLSNLLGSDFGVLGHSWS